MGQRSNTSAARKGERRKVSAKSKLVGRKLQAVLVYLTKPLDVSLHEVHFGAVWLWRRNKVSRNISDCSHFLILVSIRTALLTNIKFGEGWSQLDSPRPSAVFSF